MWCPKYRRRVLSDEIQSRLKDLINIKAKQMGCEVLALETMPDHVHLFISGDPTVSPNYIIGQIKGYTSRKLRDEFPELKKRLPTLWTRSFFVSTHGHISDNLIKKYIEEQRGM